MPPLRQPYKRPGPGDFQGPVANALDLWQAQLDAAGWPAAEGLPVAERERAATMRRGVVRRRWVAARWALRGVLARYLEAEPETIELRAGERGKPTLAAPGASLRFNLSHSGEIALVAIGHEREVGVDVERIEARRNLLALARRALPAEEAARIEALPAESRLAAFHAAWTRREAVAKCLGTGLHVPLPDVPVAIAELDLEPGYAAALAVAGEIVPPLRRFAIEPAEVAG